MELPWHNEVGIIGTRGDLAMSPDVVHKNIRSLSRWGPQIVQSEKFTDKGAGGAFAIVVSVNFYGFDGGACSLKLNVTTKSGAYTPTCSDDVILCGPSNETFTIDLDNPSGVFSGKVFYIKNIGTGITTIDANTTGGTTLDGENTQLLSQWEAIDAVSSGSAWFII